MRWCLITHPDVAAPAAIAEDSLEHYEYRGWTRVSGWTTDPHLPFAQYPPREEPTAEPEPQRKPAKTTSKENA